MTEYSIEQRITDTEIIERMYILRGERVMIDNDLAEMYGVDTNVLNKAVKRNIQRFPGNFMFQLTKPEWEGRGKYSKYLKQLLFKEEKPRGPLGSKYPKNNNHEWKSYNKTFSAFSRP